MEAMGSGGLSPRRAATTPTHAARVAATCQTREKGRTGLFVTHRARICSNSYFYIAINLGFSGTRGKFSRAVDRIGEYSLTDSRHSRITKFMAETLFDENMGGPYGNTHLALGMSYRDTYAGDVSKLTDAEADELGFNDSSVHTDIISTTKRTVTAHLKDGSEKVIYKDGQFVL